MSAPAAPARDVIEAAMNQAEVTLRIPAWIPCPACENFICTIHGQHATDCECPGIEFWNALGIDPYAPCVIPEAIPQ